MSTIRAILASFERDDLLDFMTAFVIFATLAGLYFLLGS